MNYKLSNTGLIKGLNALLKINKGFELDYSEMVLLYFVLDRGCIPNSPQPVKDLFKKGEIYLKNNKPCRALKLRS